MEAHQSMKEANTDLRRQRDVIHGTIDKTRNIGRNLDRAGREIHEINRQTFVQRVMMHVAALLLFLAIIASIAIKISSAKNHSLE